MELKLLFILYLTTLPLNISCIAIDQDEERQNSTVTDTEEYTDDSFEEKPDPSPLITAGYNLPGPIFNNGQPFYVEKDPVTGAMDFNSKTPAGKQSYLKEYDFIEEEPNMNIFDKSNIDRKDGSFGSHRPNDINQLTPNFHDFLNLPVKYNPDKYVYPLISSSYANTKIQGNVQNSYNHKSYNGTIFKPTVSPTYYTTKSSVYYQPKKTTTEKITTTTTKTTKSTTTTTEPTTKINLLNSPMNHPSYTTDDYDSDYDYFTTKTPGKMPQEKTTTQKPYSIFDELFGDYEEPKPAIKPPSLFSNLPGFGDKIKKDEIEQKMNDTKPGLTNLIAQNSHGIPLPGKEEYEYDYLEENDEIISNKSQIVTPEPTKSTVVTEKSTTKKVETVYSNFHQNYKPAQQNNTVSAQNVTGTTEKPDYISITSSENYDDYEEEEKITKSTTKIIPVTETLTNKHVTSLPLGENHPTMRMPIISLTNGNLKEQLLNEMVDITTKTPDIEKIIRPASSSNIHIAPDQDTVSFVVGNQQNIGNDQKETFVSNSFRPLYTQNQPPQQPALDQNGKVKETITFTGTGQTNSNYSWTVPQKYDTYPNFDTMPANVYNQEIQSNYSWTIPESPTKYEPVKYNPPTNSLHSSAPDFNLQQVSSGYSVGQGQNSGYAQGSVYNVGGVGASYNNRKVPPTSNYQYAQVGTNYNLTVYPEGASSVNIQPLRGTEASLSIGTPTNEVKVIPGLVVDEILDLKDPEITVNKPSNKIVFPDDKPTTYSPNREILSLYSKPVLHQLPSDLTPPEKEVKPPVRNTNVRPPWDPRPGHFYSGRPEYARPPRPAHKPEVYKRIDGLPNILPQFRPNAKVGSSGHYHDIPINSGYMQRQPLLERPSNRPIGFFEKLHPPPPPKRILELRKPVTLNQHLMQNELKERQKEQKNEQKNENYKVNEQFGGFPPQSPPKVPVANRRNGEDESEIATLQMLHAKQSDKVNTIKPNMPPPFKINYKETTDKPLYVVYPVNSSPLKLDVLDTDNKETVVIGTRSEPPLPPSKISHEFPTYTEQKPILKPKDSPILKPHPKPTFPVKTDFPYPIEKPDPTALYTPKTTTKDKHSEDHPDFHTNQWTNLDTESRIINGNKINYVAEPISATLKTYTPIAIAYTPTEATDDKYSMPNYASSVISEIRNSDKSHQHGIVGKQGSEFTVSAVMHTHHQNNMMLGNTVRKGSVTSEKLDNHKIDDVETQYPAKLDFQAPFQASVNIGSATNGWSVVRDKSKDNIDRQDDDVTTLLPETSSEFDIENFKPQMFGGFKPIYNIPDEKETSEESIEMDE